jgi:hypothetical protein
VSKGKRLFKLLQRVLELKDNFVKRWEVAADICVYRNYVPRRSDQVIEVGECGLDDVVEQIYLDLRWNGVECLALYVVRNRLETNSLAFVRDVFVDFSALAGASICSMSDITELGIEEELA